MQVPFFGALSQVSATSHSFCVAPKEYLQQHWSPSGQVGDAVGAAVGDAVGAAVGVAVVGVVVGMAVGAAVGAAVGHNVL